MGRGAGRADPRRPLLVFFLCHQGQKTSLNRGWGGETTEPPPIRCGADFLKSVGYFFFLFSWRRACFCRAEPVSPHICRSVRMVPLPAGCEGVYPAGLWCVLAACFCWTAGGIFGSCLGNTQMIPNIRHRNHFGCQKRFLFLCVIFLMLFLSLQFLHFRENITIWNT